MSDEPKKRSRAKGLSRACLSVTLFTLVVFAAHQGAHYLPAQQPSPKPITLATLVDVMEAREKLADSMTVRWTKSERYRAGALLAKQSTWTSPCEMLLKGGSMRYVGKTFSIVGGSPNVIDHVSSYDGNESRYLQGTKPPLGRILEKKVNTDARTSALLPLMLYFRPLAEPYDTLKRKTLKLVDERKTIDGHECVTVDDGSLRVNLDCERDFVPVAYQFYLEKGAQAAESSRPGFVLQDGSIEYYRKQDALRWYPKASQVTFHNRGQEGVPDRIRGDGVQTQIGAPLKDRDFALIFEPGTVVWDARTREEYRIRDDGSKEITKQRRKPVPPK
jgi:hypothetical protein